MDTTTSTSLFDESPTEVAVPQPLPVGNYHCIVNSLRWDRSTKKGTRFVEFLLTPYETDADEAELESVGGIDGKILRATFYETEQSIYRLDQFHMHCGIDLSESMSRTLRSEECINREVIAVVRHEPARDDSDVIYARVARTLPIA